MSSRVARFTAAFQALLLMGTLLLPALAAATEISTDLWVYSDGDTVTVTGIDFGADEVVSLVTTDPVGTVVDSGTTTTDGSGGFTYSFILSVTIGGIYDVAATGQVSGLMATTQFDPPAQSAFSPSSVTYGDTVNSSGSGATNNGAVTFTGHSNSPCNNAPNSALGSTTASPAGDWGPTALRPSVAVTRIKAASGTGSDCDSIAVAKAGTATTGTPSTGLITAGANFSVNTTTSSNRGVAGNVALGSWTIEKTSGPGNAGSLNCGAAAGSVSEVQTNSGFSETAVATFTCSPNGGAGTYTFVVHFSDSDGNYNNSDSTEQQVVVWPVVHATTLTASLSPDSIIYGQQTTISGVLTDDTAASFIVGVSVVDSTENNANGSCNGTATAFGNDATDANGFYTLTFTPHQAGDVDIRSTYAGDATHASAQACDTLSVSRAPTETSASLADPSITTAESTTVSGSVLSHYGVSFLTPAPGGNNARGDLSFVLYSDASCTSGASGIGAAETVNVAQVSADNNPVSEIGFSYASVLTHTISGLPQGTYGVRAVFTDNNGQDGNYSDSQSPCLTLEVIADDSDGDGVNDGVDNCPAVANADQANNDGDAIGDACDADDDNDGVLDGSDNCQFVQNAGQANNDGDALGDACDDDDDNDGVLDGPDNCNFTANAGQEDLDSDGIGDACDDDIDGDGVLNGSDNCPLTPNPLQEDNDGDGLGLACDSNDYAPVVHEAQDANGNEGDTLSTSGYFSDGDADAVLVITSLDPNVVDNGDGTWDWSLATNDQISGSTCVYVTDGDPSHDPDPDCFDWSAINVAPTATLNSADVDEGTPISLSLTDAHDVSSVDEGIGFTYAFDCGDGAGYGSFTSTSTASCPTNDNGSRSVGAKIQDKDGGIREYTDTVAIANVAPTIQSLGAGSAAKCNTANNLTINFTDPAGSYDTYTAHINWGDGNSQDVSSYATGTPVPHTYTAAGSYTVTVTVSDEDGGTSTSMTATLVTNFSTDGILQPVNWTQGNQDPSIFKWGSTLPVKIQFFDCDGSLASGLFVTLAVYKQTSSTPTYGTEESIQNTNSPDSSGVMRWTTNQYLYNLATKSLADSTATYKVTITVSATGQTVSTLFGTKAK